MHQHKCKHCAGQFVCGEDAAECFSTEITYRTCFWKIEFRDVLVYFGIVIVVLLMIIALFGHRGN